jgi:lipoprotein-anchoring transpeptidase ErfK/SrfK
MWVIHNRSVGSSAVLHETPLEGEICQSVAKVSRRFVVGGLSTLGLSGCVSMAGPRSAISVAATPVVPPMYYAIDDEKFSIPEVDVDQIDERFWRQDVQFRTRERIGTLIVDTPAKYLYHIKPDGRATRYGVGVGRQGFEWSGRAVVAYRRQWPRWTPPDRMIQRQPELRQFSAARGGMKPGVQNPLGARALYIYQNGRDTLYRIHGTDEPGSIGRSVSSGCIRLVNQDIIHLYDNVTDGSPIVVLPDLTLSPEAARL